MTTNGNKWPKMTMSGATNEKVFQRVVQLMTTSCKMSVKAKISVKASFFKIPWQLKLN